MFAEVKDMLPVSGNAYDGQIITQIKAAVLDLESSTEIQLDGVVSIERNSQTGVITDNSTITDELAIVAIATWCNMRIGNPPNYEQLERAYNRLKGQMRLSKKYTRYEGADEVCG